MPVNDEENQFLTRLAKEKQMEGVWLGAHNRNFFNQWFSVDGSEMHYQNWDQDLFELNDEPSQQHHPVLVVGQNGKWSCQSRFSTRYRPGFICLWD